jgi:hypothetical protein
MEGIRPAFAVALLGFTLLLSLAVTLPWQVPATPRGDEATFLLMVESLWHDGDLRFDPVDLERGYRHWHGGPDGLRLGEGAGEGWFYALPVVPALVALPFYGVLGTAGIRVLGVLLLALLALGGWWLHRRLHRGQRGGATPWGLFLLALAASALPAYALRLEPTLITAALATVPLLLWLALRQGIWGGWRVPLAAAVAGTLAGAAFTVEPLLLLLALVPWIDLLATPRRRWVPLLLVGLLVTVGLVGALQRKGTGEWRPAEPERSALRTFHGAFPGEVGYQPAVAPPRQVGEGSRAPGAALLPVNAGYLLVGRHGGILPYFPFALLVLGLALARGRWRERPVWLLTSAVGVTLVLLLLRDPHGYRGGVGAFANVPFALLYPALLLLLLLPAEGRGGNHLRRFPRPLATLATLAALLWSLPAVLASVDAPGEDGQRHTRLASFRVLPLEIPLAVHGNLENFWVRAGGDALWLLPQHAFFAEEGNPQGVWMRGASQAEVLVVTPLPRETLTFSVQSLSPENVFSSSTRGGGVDVHFDTPEKRRSTPVTLPLGPGRSATAGGATLGEGRVYHLRLHSSAGLVPARRDGKSADPRYLGTFLAFGDVP